MSWTLLASFNTDSETLSTETIEHYWKDKKQTIINTNSNATIFYIRDSEGNAKILVISTSTYYTEDIPTDTDQDGRYDEDENCTSTYYNIFEEDCIKTDASKRDTDEDGYWDGIEVEAKTDPNDTDSKPF